MDTTTPELSAGAIFVSTWGYEQTNVEFYEVTRLSTASVWLREVQATKEPAGNMTYRMTPRPGQYTGLEMRRKRPQDGYVRISPDARARPWDGQSARSSDYS